MADLGPLAPLPCLLLRAFLPDLLILLRILHFFLTRIAWIHNLLKITWDSEQPLLEL